jgi:fatty-acid desaturase
MLPMLKSLHFWRVWLPPHVIACLSFYYAPSWSVLAAFLVFYTLISGLGVAVGLHRYFSHKSFTTRSSAWDQLMLYFGILACHGNPLFWVALHRGLHHRFADTAKDPHSPVVNSWWKSYQGYAFDPALVSKVPIRAGADFLRHPDWQWSVKHYHKVLWGTWLIAAAVSAYFNSPWFVLGLAAAQVWAIHQEALVNLVGHLDGCGSYRCYDTDDHSVNRNILGLFTWGQSLHNNHHGDAGNPDFAQMEKFPGRWAFDPSMIWIRFISKKP